MLVQDQQLATHRSSVVRLRSVGYWYEESQKILNGVTFEISQGQILGVTGASGCGKTTLVKVVAGLLSPKVGSVSVSNSTRRVVMFQNALCLPWYRTLKNVQVATGVDKKQAMSHLRAVGLEDAAYLYPGQLSGGMRTRLAVAVAAAAGAQVLIFDEPFSGLDETNRRSIESLLLDLKADNKALMVVSHDIVSLLRVSDRIGVLAKGGGMEKAIEKLANASEFEHACEVVRNLMPKNHDY